MLSAALVVGVIESRLRGDAAKNAMSAPNPYPNLKEDWVAGIAVSERNRAAWAADPGIAAWLQLSRLNQSLTAPQHRRAAAAARYGPDTAPPAARL